MRIRIVRTPHNSGIEGIQTDHFVVGLEYEVGSKLGSLLLAEGWAEPVGDDEPPPVVPFSESDPFTHALHDPTSPRNLIRETAPPYADAIPDLVAHLERRRRPRE